MYIAYRELSALDNFAGPFSPYFPATYSKRHPGNPINYYFVSGIKRTISNYRVNVSSPFNIRSGLEYNSHYKISSSNLPNICDLHCHNPIWRF